MELREGSSEELCFEPERESGLERVVWREWCDDVFAVEGMPRWEVAVGVGTVSSSLGRSEVCGRGAASSATGILVGSRWGEGTRSKVMGDSGEVTSFAVDAASNEVSTH